jgi:hypothetical protein
MEVWWQGKGKKTLEPLISFPPSPPLPADAAIPQFVEFHWSSCAHSFYKRWIFMNLKVPSKINTCLGIFSQVLEEREIWCQTHSQHMKWNIFILLFPYSWWVNNTCQSRYLFHHISSLFHHVNSPFPKLKSHFVSLTSHFVKSPNPLCQSLNNQILSSRKIFTSILIINAQKWSAKLCHTICT